MNELTERLLISKIEEWKELENNYSYFESELFKKLEKIKDAIELLEPPIKLNLPPLNRIFSSEVNQHLFEWLWEFGLPPIDLWQENLTDELKAYIIWIPGETKTIYQVLLIPEEKTKFYCGCKRNEGALAWITTAGLCQHKIKSYYWITRRYSILFESFGPEEKEKILNRWNDLLKKYKKGKFRVKLINHNSLAVERTLEIIPSEELKEKLKWVDEVWLKYESFKENFKNEY